MRTALLALFLTTAAAVNFGQTSAAVPQATPLTARKLSQLLAVNLSENGTRPVSQDSASKAYSSLLEGERFLWSLKNARTRRSQAVTQSQITAAKAAFQKAAEMNPRLAEVYTALAELTLTAPPGDVDEAMQFAGLALKVDGNNFGARRILARLHTFKSGLGTQKLDNEQAAKAVDEWKLVASLDPRNAEAWAFLAEFYDRQGKSDERIDALVKWRSSAAPIDSGFFQRMTGGRETLSPESATLKLGEALLAGGRIQEAIETLSVVVVDEPDNESAIDTLRQAIQASTGKDAVKAIEALQAAVYANPGNPGLVDLLSEAFARAGRKDEAARVLSDAAERAGSDVQLASAFYAELGDFYEIEERYADASAAYEKAIGVRGFDGSGELTGDDRMFLTRIFEKMIRTARNANRPADIRAIIDRSRKILGPEDDFADRQLVSHYRESGKRAEALAVVKTLRAKSAGDEALARLEATLLVELGKVDEAVAGFQKYMAERAKAPSTIQGSGENAFSISGNDPFSSQLFISQLYSQANRGKEAVQAGHQALALARGPERRQIARLTIATAQQNSGDHAGAETTLRDILKESPDNPIAQNNLGYFLLERGIRYEEALKLIQQAVETDPTNPSFLDSLGWAYFKLGRDAEAERQLREALKFDAMSSAINEHLGDVLQKQGKNAPARTHWQRALDLASDTADVSRLKEKLTKAK